MAEKAHRFLSFVLLALFSVTAMAQVQAPEPPPPAPEVAQRIKKLETELRCLVCQNQTLAESPAGLAGDLRREVRALVEAGKSDADIKAFLQARYGDFVLYRPPVAERTWLLWFGPFAFLFAGAAAVAWVAKRRAPGHQAAVARPDVPASARALLENRAPRVGRVLTADADIAALLRGTRTVAVVGLSNKTERPSYRVAAYLQSAGYRVIPVNPGLSEVLGEKAYPSLADVPPDILIDMVDCFRREADMPEIAKAAVARGAKSLWMQLDIKSAAAAATATAAGLDVVMDRCTKIEHARLPAAQR